MRYCVTCDRGGPFIASTGTNPPFLIRTADPRTDLFVSREIHHSGLFDAHVLNVMRKAINRAGGCLDGNKRRLILDIGANMGFFGLYAASRGCDVFLAEMQPNLVHFIKTSALLNDWNVVPVGESESESETVIQIPESNRPTNSHHILLNEPTIYIYNGALGDKTGTVSFHINSKNLGGTSIMESASAKGKIVYAKMERLDTLMESISALSAETIFVKMDVEGAELKVVQGAANTFAALKGTRIVIETTATTQDDVLREMLNLGFSAHDIVTGALLSSGGQAKSLRILEKEDILFKRAKGKGKKKD